MESTGGSSIMGTGRLEAFSDGVLAILITIMAFQLVPPESGQLADLRDSLPTFLSFALSFAFLGIYWNNHHHLLRATDCIDGAVMWANLGLLFFLTLIPAATDWLASHHEDSGPAALYGIICFLCGVGFAALVRTILRANPGSVVVEAIGRDRKGKLSLLLYASGVALAFVNPYLSVAMYVSVSIMWFVPDRRLARI